MIGESCLLFLLLRGRATTLRWGPRGRGLGGVGGRADALTLHVAVVIASLAVVVVTLLLRLTRPLAYQIVLMIGEMHLEALLRVECHVASLTAKLTFRRSVGMLLLLVLDTRHLTHYTL